MASTLIDATTIAQFSQVDITAYPAPYVNNMFQVAHDLIAGWLDYDPAAQVHTNEEGWTELGKSGRDQYQIIFNLKHIPLTNTLSVGTGGVFTDLKLLFPAPFPSLDLITMAQVTPSQITISQTTGHCTTPYLGSAGLPGALFQYGGGSTPVTGPVGYLATYSAGYAISSADAAAYPSALPVPSAMQQACAWIFEGLLAQSTRVAQDINNATNGYLMTFRNLEYEERYAPINLAQATEEILAGSIQGVWAIRNLKRFRKETPARVFFV